MWLVPGVLLGLGLISLVFLLPVALVFVLVLTIFRSRWGAAGLVSGAGLVSLYVWTLHRNDRVGCVTTTHPRGSVCTYLDARWWLVAGLVLFVSGVALNFLIQVARRDVRRARDAGPPAG